jgi:hypothetical protein
VNKAIVGVVGVAMLVAIIAAVFVMRRPSRSVDATVSLNASPPAIAATTENPAPPSPAVALPAISAPAVSASAVAAPAVARSPGGPAPRSPVQVKKDGGAKPTTRKANCNPNFYLDATGEKHFKPECF